MDDDADLNEEQMEFLEEVEERLGAAFARKRGFEDFNSVSEFQKSKEVVEQFSMAYIYQLPDLGVDGVTWITIPNRGVLSDYFVSYSAKTKIL